MNKTWWGKNESEKPRKSQSHLLNCFFFSNSKIYSNQYSSKSKVDIFWKGHRIISPIPCSTDVKKYETFFLILWPCQKTLNLQLINPKILKLKQNNDLEKRNSFDHSLNFKNVLKSSVCTEIKWRQRLQKRSFLALSKNLQMINSKSKQYKQQ